MGSVYMYVCVIRIIKREAIDLRGSRENTKEVRRRGRSEKDINTVLIYDILF